MLVTERGFLQALMLLLMSRSTSVNIYSIYKATNKINQKVYIGFDSKWPNRQKDHFKDFNSKESIIFYRAIKKYGWDAFDWEVIYQSTDGEHTLNIMENYFIVANHSFIGYKNSNGYNMTLGGNGSLGAKRSKSFKFNQSKLAKEKGWCPPQPKTPEEMASKSANLSKSTTLIWANRKELGIDKGIFCWITNGLENNRIRTILPIPNGWRRGRTIKRDPITKTFVKQ